MRVPLIDYINFGIIAHVDHGKTTLTEIIRYLTGDGYKIGAVHDGTAYADWMKQEQERGITITAAVLTTFWNKKRLTIIDTPGHIDFTVEVIRSLRVLDGAVTVVDACAGVSPQTRQVSKQAREWNVPVIVFVNKIDKVGADFYRVVEEVRTELDLNPVIVAMPIGQEGDFKGVVRVLENDAVIWDEGDTDGKSFSVVPVPEDMKADVEAKRIALVEAIVETDEKLLEVYDGTIPAIADLKAALRRATIARALAPVLVGSAFKRKGIQPLLDAICDFLPSPLEVPAVSGINPKTEEPTTRETDEKAPLCAMVFKLGDDPEDKNKGGAQVTYLRNYSGVLRSGTTVLKIGTDLNGETTSETMRIGRLCIMQGPKKVNVEELRPGELGVITGYAADSGDTLCDINHPIALDRIKVGEPVVAISVAPADKAKSQKTMEELTKLRRADPSVRLVTDPETNETYLMGVGKLQLDVICDLMKERGCPVIKGKPQVKYRETPTIEVDFDYLHKKQTGGTGQMARIKGRLGPNPGKGFSFDNQVVGGNIPKEYIPGIEHGMEDSMKKGPLGKFPVVDVSVVITDGAYHEVDSSVLAFEIAAKGCFREYFLKTKPVLLEPWGVLEVVVPEQDLIGPVIGYINGKRGQVSGQDQRGTQCVIHAAMPIAETFDLADDLRSITGGRVDMSLLPGNYAEVPSKLSAEILEQRVKDKAA